MNLLLIAKIIGAALSLEAVLLVLPLLFAVLYNESLMPFSIPKAICFVAGALLMRLTDKENMLQSKEGLVATGLTWIA